MQEFFTQFLNWFKELTDLLSSVQFRLYGYNVNLLSIFIAFIVIGFIVSFFWKGAKA